MTEESLFVAAMGLADPADRASYLRGACSGDDALRLRVEALLAAHDRPGELLSSGRPPHTPTTQADATADAVVRGASTLSITPGRDPSTTAVGYLGEFGETSEKPGDRIGPYTLGRTLGEGGMGVVFEAEQHEPVRRRVALKVIKAGMDTRQVVARFGAERQALALMEHPGIARVLDAGATESGRPFFVMEIVDGIPITDYCDSHRLATRQRLQLLIPVCKAVQHAHQKGVIHRDLKPSNVLVAEVDGRPVPKVIDFGIAKAIDRSGAGQTIQTQDGVIVGTPRYMSPEQAGGAPDVDTRTDVYALGVLLYELLTGSTPLGNDPSRREALLETLRRIREEDPPKPSMRLADSADRLASISAARDTEPSRLTRMVRGDLDWVTMKALERDRSRRYGTAAALAADLRGYLDGDPVTAGPPSRSYRLGKFAAKHRGALAMASGFALLLVATTALSAWQAVRADRARRDAVHAEGLARIRLEQVERANAKAREALADATTARIRADQDRAQAEAVSQYLVEVFRKPDPGRDGRELKVADLLDGAVLHLGADFKGSAQAKVALLLALSRTYRGLGLPNQSATVAEEALRQSDATLGPDQPPTLQARHNLAVAYSDTDRPGDSLRLHESTLKAREALLGADHADTLQSRYSVAMAYSGANRPGEALRLLQATLEAQEVKLGPDHPSTLMSRHGLAVIHGQAGRVAESIRLYEEILKVYETKSGPDHPSTLTSRNNLADAYDNIGRHAEAIALYEATVKAQAVRLGPDHPSTLLTRYGLANAYRNAGRIDDAIRLYESTHKAYESSLGRNYSYTVGIRNQLVGTYHAANRGAEAVALLEETLRSQEATLGPDHPGTLKVRDMLGAAYVNAGRWVEAIPLLEAAGRAQEETLGPDHPERLASLSNLALAYGLAGRKSEAVALLERVLKGREARLGFDHFDTFWSRHHLAYAYIAAGRRREAIATYEVVLTTREKSLGLDHPATLGTRDTLADIDQKCGRLERAIAGRLANLRSREAKLGPDHPETARSRESLARLFQDGGRFDQAEPLRDAILAAHRKAMGDDHPDTIGARLGRADLDLARGYHDAADSAYRRILDSCRVKLGPDHACTARAEDGLRLVRRARGGESALEPLRCAAVQEARRAAPADLVKLAESLAEWGQCLLAGRNWAEAEPIARECLAACEEGGSDTLEVLRARGLLGGALLGQGRLVEAEPQIVASYEGLKSREEGLLPTGRARLVEAGGRIIALYQAWGKPERVSAWRDKIGPAAELPSDVFAR